MLIKPVKFREKTQFIIIIILFMSGLVLIINNTDLKRQNLESTYLSLDSPKFIHNAANFNDFQYYKEITIDHTKVSGSTDLVNFSVLISILDSDLQDYTQPDGDDIAFHDGSEWLDHEIELYNRQYSPTQAKLVVWVRIPSLSASTDTTIYMYYGNPTMESQENPNGVWDPNYKAVWHLNTTLLDSTTNNNEGTNSVPGPDDVNAFIARGRDYDYTASDYSNMGSGSSIDNLFNGGATISAWIYPEGYGGGNYGRILDKASATDGSNGWSMCVDGVPSPSNHLLFFRGFSDNRGLWYTPQDSITVNQWSHIVVTYNDGSDLNDPTIYINGIQQSIVEDVGANPDGTASNDAAQTLSIGNHLSTLTRGFYGVIDEVRLVKGIKSSDWVLTEYNNQYNPNSFYTVGSPVIIDNTPPDLTIISPSSNSLYGSLEPSFNVEINDSNTIDSRWYRLLNGTVTTINTTFITNGSISQTRWAEIGNGTVSIEFFANDSAGNIGFAEVLVRKDIISPTIVINSPNNFDLFGSIPPDFNIEAWDINNVDDMWYTLNNSKETLFTTNGTISQSLWNTCGNGTVSIKFYANDSLSNVGFSEVIVRKEVSAPNIHINSPANYELFGKTSPNFNVEIGDDNGVDDMWYTLNNGVEIFFTSNGTISQSLWNTCGNGTVSIKFYANNSLGNGAFTEVIVRKDIINPSIVINDPDDYDLYGNLAPSFNVLINDPNGVESKWYTLNGGITNTTFTSNGIINQTRWNEMENGTVIIRFYAEDSLGNIGYSEVIVQKDILSPTININSPSPYELFGAVAPSFNVEIFDSSGINTRWYSIDDGITNITFTSNGTINSGLWSLKGNGTVTIRFSAKDSLGNEGFSEVIVRKDIDPPSILINSPNDYDIFDETSPNFNVEITDINGVDTMWYSLDGGYTKTIFTTNSSINQAIWSSYGSGNIAIRFYANNSIGTTGYSEVTVIKDIDSPTIVINSPNDYDLFGNTTPNFNVEIWDDNGVDDMWYTLNNSIKIFFTINDTISDSIWNTIGNGTISIKFYANDSLGNEGFSEIIIRKDVNPPIIVVNSPNDYDLFGSIAPNFNVEIWDDNGVDEMRYTLNNSIEIFFTINGTISDSIWNTIGNGTVSIKFYANDSLGNEGFSEIIVRKDVNPPTIVINSPNDYDLFGSIAPDFNVEIWDDNGVDDMWYTLNNSIETYFTNNGTISSSVWSICGNGMVSIKFYANNSLGNEGFSEVIVQKVVSAPTIVVNSPINYDLFGNNAPNFNVEIWDDNGVDHMWYTLNNGIETYFTDNGTISPSLWTIYSNGTVSIKFYANNSLGNGAFVEVIVRKDVINPVVTINTPSDYTLYGKLAPSYNVLINDPNGIESKWYTLDGGITNTTFTSNGIINQTRWDEMGNGTITIKFYAKDNVGNIGYSEVIVQKDIIAPTIVINSPSPYELFGAVAPSFNVEIFDSSGINERKYTIDDGVINITFTINGTINSGLWSLKGNGTVTIRFFAKDSLGNEGFSEVIVRKDMDPPSIVINNPTLNQCFGESSPNFNVEITDINGVDTMWYSLDEGYTKTIFTTNNSINQVIWETFGDGNINIRFYANNSVGTTGYSEVNVIKDMYAPSISINSPNNNTYWNHAPIINIHSYDINFDNLWITIGNTNISISSDVNFQLNSSIWNSLPQGPFQIIINANDTLGHRNSILVNLHKDTINPNAPVLVLFPEGEVSIPIIFDWEDESDTSGISYYRLIIDNEANPFATSGFIFEVNITNVGTLSSYYELTEYLSPRNYYYFIYCVDGAGNQGVASSGTFIIAGSTEPPAEFPWWLILIIALPLGLIIAIVAARKSKKVKVVVVDKEIEMLKEHKMQLEMKARSALKAGNYQYAAELYTQCRNISNQLMQNGIEEDKDKFRNFDKIEKELQLKIAAIPLTYACINNLMTKYFDQLGIKYYSNPDIYPEIQDVKNGLILNDTKFLESRLLNPTSGEQLKSTLNIQPDQIGQINGIQFVYTNDLSEECLIQICKHFQNQQMILFIVGINWPNFEYDEMMAIPRDDSINYKENIRIINNDLFIRLIGIEGEYQDLFNEIIETKFDYNELDVILKRIETNLHDTQELKNDLKQKEWFFFL